MAYIRELDPEVADENDRRVEWILNELLNNRGVETKIWRYTLAYVLYGCDCNELARLVSEAILVDNWQPVKRYIVGEALRLAEEIAK